MSNGYRRGRKNETRNPREPFSGAPVNSAIYEKLIVEPRERSGGHLALDVSQHFEVRSGELVFAGTEVPVRDLIEHLKSSKPLNDFTRHQYATVTQAQTLAYLEETLRIVEQLAKTK